MGVVVSNRGEHDFSYVNMTGLPDADLDPVLRETAAQIVTWTKNVRKAPTMFDRVGYDLPDNPYEGFLVAENAVRLDDVIGGLADVTEGLALQGLKWESANMDDADIFNQISGKIGLDSQMRVIWRELYSYSQVVVAEWWEMQTIRVRTPAVGTGRKRRKTYDVYAPSSWMVLDPHKIVPVGSRIFDNDPLAWAASSDEYETWLKGTDPLLNLFFPTKYETTDNDEIERIGGWGIDYDRLLLADPEYVYRYTVTKPQYKPFADLRLGNVFPLLDMKIQLMKADRVSLVGAANYILLVKKGSKEEPAHQSEVDNLRDNFRVIARVPVIVSDHRLSIEIITPKNDFTLEERRYRLLDNKIAARVLGYHDLGSATAAASSSEMNARMIGRYFENSRQMMRRLVEKRIAERVIEKNLGVFEREPNLAFTPRHLDIEGKDTVLKTVMALRARNELSRETMLETVGFDQDVEAVRRQNEEESGMDDIFETAVPFNSPDLPRPGDVKEADPAQNEQNVAGDTEVKT